VAGYSFYLRFHQTCHRIKRYATSFGKAFILGLKKSKVKVVSRQTLLMWVCALLWILAFSSWHLRKSLKNIGVIFGSRYLVPIPIISFLVSLCCKLCTVLCVCFYIYRSSNWLPDTNKDWLTDFLCIILLYNRHNLHVCVCRQWRAKCGVNGANAIRCTDCQGSLTYFVHIRASDDIFGGLMEWGGLLLSNHCHQFFCVLISHISHYYTYANTILAKSSASRGSFAPDSTGASPLDTIGNLRPHTTWILHPAMVVCHKKNENARRSGADGVTVKSDERRPHPTGRSIEGAGYVRISSGEDSRHISHILSPENVSVCDS